MEVILNKNDIETLINSAYSGVEKVTFGSDDLKISLEVDAGRFGLFKKSPIPMQSTSNLTSIPKDKMSPDDRQQLEASQGAMASGGGRRNIKRIG